MRHHFSLRFVGIVTLLGLLALAGFAQNPASVDPQITTEIQELEQRLKKLQEKLKALKETPAPVKTSAPETALPARLDRLFAWRPIGPANMGGRITALAVVENDPTCYYVGTASGGLLKTVNNGSTFVHQFDHESTVSIGAVAVAPTNRDLVWVGTGEANPRNSVSYGDGVYRSTDGGKTWQNMGLKKSFQIGKIVIHPTNPDIVYVGALGRLYGPSEERGLYKTSDGGKTWQQVWFHDNKTGVLDVVLQPSNPEVLILAAWERQRDEFDSFVGDAKPPAAADVYAPVKPRGPGSGLYKTTDGGKTWKKLTGGLPKAEFGRIGLDWHRKNANMVLAIIDTDKAGMGLAPSKGFTGFIPENTPQGVRIASVQKESPAGKASLAKGDLLLALDGKDLKKTDDLLVPLQPKVPGDKIKLTYQRGDKKDTVELTLAGQPGPDPKGARRGSLSVQVEETEDGIVLTDVLEGGPAEKAGLKAGDLLLTLDNQKLGTLPILMKSLGGKEVGETVKISYKRGTEMKEIDLILEPPPAPKGRPFAGVYGGQRANVHDLQGPGSNDTGGVYKSTDGGDTWTRLNSFIERPFYFSVVRGDPNDENTIYALGIKLYRSTDGGRTFSSDGINTGVHSDLHDLWIDAKDSRHVLAGCDGGLYVSYDRAAHWEHLDHLALGQFYHVDVDARKPYRVYGGLQDNGSWSGPSQTLRPSGPTNADYQYLQGGDGFVCRVDRNEPDIVYAESQDGVMLRHNLRTGEGKSLRPRLQAGMTKYRWNWNTPFILSHHNSHIFYAGGNYVFRSVKQGEDLKVVSPEITRTKHGTATALAESPLNADVVWAGTDDGAVWVTRDGSKTWTNLSDRFKSAGLPGPRWVASIEPSRSATGRCYVVFDAHRSNDDEPYVFVTDDYGETWKSLRANLPTGSTRVLREDIKNSSLLYLGTEFALFASLDRGESWFKINGKALPTVAVHEVAQPTTADEIVAATHGRSLWVLDVTTLRQLKTEHAKGKADLFAPGEVTRWHLDYSREGMFSTGTRQFVGENPPESMAVLDFVLAKKADKLSLKVLDLNGKVVRELDVAKANEPGVHRLYWDLSSGEAPKGKGFGFKKKESETPPPSPKEAIEEVKSPRPSRFRKLVSPGTYRVVLSVDGTEITRVLTVEPDPRTRTPGGLTNEADELRRLLKNNP